MVLEDVFAGLMEQVDIFLEGYTAVVDVGGGVFQGNCAMAGVAETARRSEDVYVSGEEQEAMVM